MEKKDLAHLIGANVKKFRESRGLTQSKFAEALGISTSYCALIETGRKVPSTWLLRHMSVRMGVPADYFLFEHGVGACRKNIDLMLAGKPPEYVAFVEQLVLLCNEYITTTRNKAME